MQITELEQEIEKLKASNNELLKFKQEYLSSKQSFCRMSARLRKLCKKLTPTQETVLEMQKIASEIRELTAKATST